VGALTRTVRGLSLIELAQGKGLTPEQRGSIKPILESASSTDPMSEDQAQKLNDQLQSALNEGRKAALTELAPARGGRGGGPGGPGAGRGGMMGGGPPRSGSGGMMRGMGGPPGMRGRPGVSGGMGGFGGGQVDFDHPFKSGPNKENLDRLLSR